MSLFYLADGFHGTPIIDALWAKELPKAIVDHSDAAASRKSN